MNNPTATPSHAHPFLDLCLESDLLDIEVTPSGSGAGFQVGVTAKTLGTSTRVYALSVRPGIRGMDARPTAQLELWVTVDGAASKLDAESTDFGNTLEGLPDEDRDDVIEATRRLAEIHGSATRIVGQFMTHAQGHVFSLLNGLASQAGGVYPRGEAGDGWQDALEAFIRSCRMPGLTGVRLSASLEGPALVDATACCADPLTGKDHRLSVAWMPGGGGVPERRVSVDGAGHAAGDADGDLGGLFLGAPQGSRERLAESLARLAKLARLAEEVVFANQLGTPDMSGTPEEIAAFLLEVQLAGAAVGGGALETLNGLARLHTGD